MLIDENAAHPRVYTDLAIAESQTARFGASQPELNLFASATRLRKLRHLWAANRLNSFKGNR